MCTALEEYEEVTKTLPLDFMEYDTTWIVSNICGNAGALGAEVIELSSCPIWFGCAPEELLVVVVKLSDWMDNSAPPLVHLSHTNVLPPGSAGLKVGDTPRGYWGDAP